MLTNTRRTYRLADYTVEKRTRGWFYTKTAHYDDKEEWRGPYTSIASVTLMIARALKKEIATRDSMHALPE